MERKAFKRHLESVKHQQSMGHRARLMAKAEELARHERAAQREKLNANAELNMNMINPVLCDPYNGHRIDTRPTEEEAQMWEDFDFGNNDRADVNCPQTESDGDILQDLEEKILGIGLWDVWSGQSLVADQSEEEIMNMEDDEAVLSELMQNAGEFFLTHSFSLVHYSFPQCLRVL